MKNCSPPRFFLRFFQWYCHPKLRDHIEGDLMEVYNERLRTLGKRKADRKFIIDVLLLFRPGIIKPVQGYKNLNTYGMYKSYFKIGWRNLLKNKMYSTINIAGLATGMSVALLIGLWIWDELSFDSYFQNHNQLAQVMLNQTHEGTTYTGGTIQMPLGEALRTGYAADFKAVSLASWNEDHILAAGDKKLPAKGMWVQHDFPDMFSLAMQNGRRDGLNDPSTVLISESLAKALFNTEDPINKTIRIDNELEMSVGGVYEDLPYNTTFYDTRILLPWDNNANWRKSQTSWNNHCGQLFVQLANNADLTITSAKIKNVPTPFIKDWLEEIMLHPLKELHLYNEFENGKAAGGRIQFVWLMGIIGVFVLLLACINFMNLSTARSERRAKEVGIRKTIGSLRSQLIGQFISESLVVSFLALILSLVLTQLSLPFFNTLASKQMSVPWQNPVFWLLVSGFTLLTGVVSGSYPAFYLSGFKPVKVLKGTFNAGRFAVLPRKVLVVIQFTVSTTLIIGTIIVFQQIEHAKSRTAGFAREGLITIGLNTPDLRNHYGVVANELQQTDAVKSVSLSSQSPAHFGNNNSIHWRGKDPGLVIFFRNVNVTADFGKTLGWSIKEGRDFLYYSPADSASVILNETGIKIMGFENPLGEVIKYNGKGYKIVGVVEDMVTQSPYQPIQPAIFFTDGYLGVFVIRLNPTVPVREGLAEVEKVFKKYNPDAPFEYSFVDEVYGRKFANEERIANLTAVFAILAVLISCLGLFGLASFVAEQRTKEIGIRKVLGATIANLWKLLSRDFIVLVIISFSVAIPFSAYFMHGWLMQFPYRMTMSWQLFAAVMLGVLALILVTVSYQAVRAAIANPVKSLRSE